MTKQDDGADTFGQYQNGGITAGHVLHFLAAHYVVGDPEPAARILLAMLERQGRDEFQNGVRNAAGQGIDWTVWDGTAQEVWRQQGPDVSALAGRPVRLRFVMRSAKLFAFQFIPPTDL